MSRECSSHTERRIAKREKHTRAYKRLRRIFFAEEPKMYRVVRSWVSLIRDALMYGVVEQMIHGRMPLVEAIEPYEEWKPKNRLEKMQLDLRADEVAKQLKGVAVVPQYQKPYTRLVNNQIRVLANWNCIRTKGERAIGNHHLRIYGEAMNTAGQIARISTSWDVVNERAVAWAAKHTNKMVTLVTEQTKSALREVISTGIKEGDSIETIGRHIRSVEGVGLNRPQMKSLMRLEQKLAVTKMKPKNQLKALRRRSRKMRRYRAEMIARTETSRAVSAGTIDGYKEGGIKRRRFEATGDACQQCAWRDGSVYEWGKAEGLIPLHPNCLPKITPIYSSEGWKPIKDIQVGDLVLTHKGRFRKVIQLHRSPIGSRHVVCIKMKGNTKKLTLTDNHTVLVGGVWVAAGDLKAGDKISCLVDFCAGEYRFADFAVESAEHHPWLSSNYLYNLSVEEDESYVAKGFVVHNCRCVWVPVLSSRRGEK